MSNIIHTLSRKTAPVHAPIFQAGGLGERVAQLLHTHKEVTTESDSQAFTTCLNILITLLESPGTFPQVYKMSWHSLNFIDNLQTLRFPKAPESCYSLNESTTLSQARSKTLTPQVL